MAHGSHNGGKHKARKRFPYRNGKPDRTAENNRQGQRTSAKQQKRGVPGLVT